MQAPMADRDIPTAVYLARSAVNRFLFRRGINACRTALYMRVFPKLTGQGSGMKSYKPMTGPLRGFFIPLSIHCHCSAKAQEKEPPMLSIKG